MADGHCLLCDCVHPRYEHRCALCGMAVHEDVVRFSLAGRIWCDPCKRIFEPEDAGDEGPQIRLRDALIRRFIHRTLNSADFATVLRKALGGKGK